LSRELAVEVHGVTKHFPRRTKGWPWRPRRHEVALHPIDLQLAAGTTTGVIGPNGSGKSTLVRIISTLLLPDSGWARVFGHDVVDEARVVRRHVNRVSVEAAFFKELSAWENLLYAARLYNTPIRGLRSRVEDLLGRFGLGRSFIDRPLRQLSRGQQQKVAIARSLLTTPSLLLMDEPTTGLDPRSKREVQEMIDILRAEREVTIVVCTHDMAEAEQLCERVLLMDRGKVLADGTPSELGSLEELFFARAGRAMEDADFDEEKAKEKEEARAAC
jgi:ABC-2 type transport system ATP-binding protein